jgi:peptidoglycan hydrolase-like protein with peptidoglycan-binding domain
MFALGRFGIFVAFIVTGQVGAFNPLTIIRTATAQSIRLAQTGAAVDPNVLRIQEALVWIGYYEGPIDGSAGPGTQSAIRRFQRDIGKAETGSLDDAQSAMLAQRAQPIVQLTGYRSMLDTRSGIRSGLPLGLLPRSKGFAGGSDYASPDNQMQIGLRTFRTSKDAASLFSELKSRLERSSTTVYSVGRSTWFVLAGESENRKYYLRYAIGPDVIAGFFSAYDKSLPREAVGPYVAAVTLMSLTMQPFAATLGKDQIPALTDIGQLQPIVLSETTPSSQQGQPPAAIPEQSTANDATTLALQRKISELEAKQRELERQLVAKNHDASKSSPLPKVDASAKQLPQANADSIGKPTSRPNTPVKPTPPDSGIGYGTLAILAVACALLLFFRIKRPSPAPPATNANASAAPSSATSTSETRLATANVAPAQQHAEPPATVPAAAGATPAPVTAAALAGSSGLNVALLGGGMIFLVFLLALIVSKIASFTGFS